MIAISNLQTLNANAVQLFRNGVFKFHYCMIVHVSLLCILLRFVQFSVTHSTALPGSK